MSELTSSSDFVSALTPISEFVSELTSSSIWCVPAHGARVVIGLGVRGKIGVRVSVRVRVRGGLGVGR